MCSIGHLTIGALEQGDHALKKDVGRQTSVSFSQESTAPSTLERLELFTESDEEVVAQFDENAFQLHNEGLVEEPHVCIGMPALQSEVGQLAQLAGSTVEGELQMPPLKSGLAQWAHWAFVCDWGADAVLLRRKATPVAPMTVILRSLRSDGMDEQGRTPQC